MDFFMGTVLGTIYIDAQTRFYPTGIKKQFFIFRFEEAKPSSVLKEAAESSHLNHLASIAYKPGWEPKL